MKRYTEYWKQEALCGDPENYEYYQDLFFSDIIEDIIEAKELCRECPVLAECLEAAIEVSEPWGVWGGQLFYNGQIIVGKRRPGRPRKGETSFIEFPEVPVPEHLESVVEELKADADIVLEYA